MEAVQPLGRRCPGSRAGRRARIPCGRTAEKLEKVAAESSLSMDEALAQAGSGGPLRHLP